MVNRPLVPTISLMSSPGSSTLIAYVPKARRRTGPNSASRSKMGFMVPHLRSVNWRVFTKYTSALKGELNPYFQPLSVARIGRFLVSSVYVPGPNTSATAPSFTKTADWPSRTTSFAPVLISFWCRSNRYTSVFCEESSHSTMSISSPASFFQMSMRPPLPLGGKPHAPGEGTPSPHHSLGVYRARFRGVAGAGPDHSSSSGSVEPASSSPPASGSRSTASEPSSLRSSFPNSAKSSSSDTAIASSSCF